MNFKLNKRINNKKKHIPSLDLPQRGKSMVMKS